MGKNAYGLLEADTDLKAKAEAGAYRQPEVAANRERELNSARATIFERRQALVIREATIREREVIARMAEDTIEKDSALRPRDRKTRDVLENAIEEIDVYKDAEALEDRYG